MVFEVFYVKIQLNVLKVSDSEGMPSDYVWLTAFSSSGVPDSRSAEMGTIHFKNKN